MEIINKSKRILITILSLITFITALFLYMGYVQNSLVLDIILKEEKSIATDIYKNSFKQLSSTYESLAKNILLNPQIIKAFEENNRTELLRITKPIYDNLRKDNPYLKIMHFHTKDTKSFLRLHKPQKFGDDLSSIRHMINTVNKTKRKQVGIEVGRYGISYRVALPVINKNGKHLGAFEFGVDINYIINLFEKDYHFKATLFLDKSFFPIIKEVSTNFRKFSDSYYIVNAGIHSQSLCEDLSPKILDNSHIIMNIGDSDYLFFNVTDLNSANKSHLGKLIFTKKIDFYTKHVLLIRNITIIVSILIMLLTFYMLRRIFTSYSSTIHSYNAKLEIKNRALSKLSNTDHLTQLSNRKHIDSIFKREIKRSYRYEGFVSVILFDVDNFKNVNDTYGHNIGDKVLKKIAKTVSSSVRELDAVGRWGGEEFIVVCPETSLHNTMILAEKIRKNVEDIIFIELSGVTCSFGVAQYDNKQSYENLIHAADMALYKAKHSGKNRVEASTNEK